MRLFPGDGWAEGHYDVEVMDGAGKVLAKRRLPEGVTGISQLHELIGRHLSEDADAAEVIVGIETGRRPWVTALIAAGCTVFPVSPLQASTYRACRGGVARVPRNRAKNSWQRDGSSSTTISQNVRVCQTFLQSLLG